MASSTISSAVRITFWAAKAASFWLADDAPDMGVAIGIGALHVNNGDIKASGRHNHHILTRIGIGHRAVLRVEAFQIACRVGSWA